MLSNMKVLSSRHGIALVSLAAIFVIFHAWAFVTRPDTATHLYHAVPWADIPAHLVFGAFLALLLLYPNFFRYSESFIVVFSLVMLAGIGWEFFEHGYDVLYGMPRGIAAANHGVFDTVKDIADNGLGAIAALALFRKRNR